MGRIHPELRIMFPLYPRDFLSMDLKEACGDILSTKIANYSQKH
jgi:hypothetical protein